MKAKQHAIKQPVGQWGDRKIPTDKLKQKQNGPKSMGHSKSNSKRRVHRATSLSQKLRKFSNKQCNFVSRGTRKRRTNKSQSL